MSTSNTSHRHRRALGVLLVMAVVGVTALGALFAPAGAVPTSSDPTRPVSVTVSPITGLTNGSAVSYTVTPTGADGNLSGDIQSRICSTGALISNNTTFGNSGGRCIDPNTVSGSLTGAEYLKVTGPFVGPTPQATTHNVGTGTVTWTGSFGGGVRTLTCNNLNPCNLVIRVNTSGGSGPVFFTETLNFAAPPAPPAAPTGLAVTPGDGNALVSWNKITDANPAVTTYGVTATPDGLDAGCATAVVVGPISVPQPAGAGAVSQVVSPLVNGCSYGFTVTATNGQGTSPAAGPVSAEPEALARFIFQTINVTRPEGALVLTQACATANPYPDEDTVPGPVGDVSEVVYGTNCTVDLGTATLVKSGAQAGQYFRAAGAIREVTIIDTRDTDDGWVVDGVLVGPTGAPGGNFVSGSNQFSGKNLGWTPAAPTVTPAIPANDIDPGYAQAASAGAAVAPISAGLKTSKNLATAVSGSGLGIAKLNAGLEVMIPIFNQSGLYTATLQITAI